VRYESCVRVHVRPLLGDLDISRLDGDVLDSFFTTLRRCIYSAWRPEADRRVASTVSDRLPAPPLRPYAMSDVAAPALTMSAKAPTEPTDPWRQTAADLRGAVLCGALKPGDQLPSSIQQANRYKVAASTAHRAVAELADLGLVTVSRGKRAIVTGQ
jgi:hypothetical protein